MYDGPNQSVDPNAGPSQSVDLDAGATQSVDGPDGGTGPQDAGPEPLPGGLRRDDSFEQVTGDTPLEAKDLPKNIQLPPELVTGMQGAWDKSFPDGHSQEQGGILVKNSDGSYEWKAGAPGTSGSFPPNYGDAGADQTVVGLGHTHPYDKDEGGYTGVPFSGQDLARQVYSKDRFNMVQSGDQTFATTRSKEFDQSLEGLDDDGKKKMFDQIKNDWNDVYTNAKGNVTERAEAATRATTQKYHMPYYQGTGDQMHQVEPEPPKAP